MRLILLLMALLIGSLITVVGFSANCQYQGSQTIPCSVLPAGKDDISSECLVSNLSSARGTSVVSNCKKWCEVYCRSGCVGAYPVSVNGRMSGSYFGCHYK